MSPEPTPPGRAAATWSGNRWSMEAASPEGLLGLTLVVATSLVVLVYVFLRMAGVVGGDSDRHGRPPPPSPLG